MNDIELLRSAIESGIIDLTTIQSEVQKKERQRILKEHSQKIWQGKNGYWYTYLENEEGRRLIKKKERSAIEDVIVEHYSTDNITVKKVFEEWLDQKTLFGDIQKQTIDRYNNDFIRFFGKVRNKPIKSIDEYSLEIFIKTTIKEMNMDYKCWGNMRILIYGIWKYARKHKYTDLSITQFMGDMEMSKNMFKRKYVDDEKQVLSKDEYEKVLEYTYKHISELTIGVRLSLLTGMRAGEITALKYSDMDGDELIIQRTEVRYKDEYGKTGYHVRDTTKGSVGYRKIVLTDEAKATIEEANRLYGGEYLIEKDGQRIKGQGYSQKMYLICDKLKIPRRSLHKCRKTYATRLLDAGVPEKLVINQMGHTSIKTTHSYYWYRNTTVAEDKKLLESVT